MQLINTDFGTEHEYHAKLRYWEIYRPSQTLPFPVSP